MNGDGSRIFCATRPASARHASASWASFRIVQRIVVRRIVEFSGSVCPLVGFPTISHRGSRKINWHAKGVSGEVAAPTGAGTERTQSGAPVGKNRCSTLLSTAPFDTHLLKPQLTRIKNHNGQTSLSYARRSNDRYDTSVRKT